MYRIRRLSKLSLFLVISWLMVLGITTKTHAVEADSSTTNPQVTASTNISEQNSEDSSTEKPDSGTSLTDESSAESQENIQFTVKGKREYGSELLTNVSLTDIANNPIQRVKSSDKIKVNYSFYLPDEVQAGDELTFELPPILQMINYSEFPLLSENGSKIGLANVDRTTNKITVTFNDYVTNHNTISGQFFFWVKLVNEQTVEGVNPIPLPVNGTTSNLELAINKANGISTGTTNPTTIFKSGKFDSIDPQKINWTITLNNSGQNLLLPIINDNLGAGQQLLVDTFSVNYRDADKKSLKKYSLPSIIQGDITNVIPTANGFTLALQSLGSYSVGKGYVSAVINYSTKVTDSSVRYVNNANTLDEAGTPQSRNASLTNYANGGIGNGDVNQVIDVLTDKIDETESIDLEELTDNSAQKLIEAKENAQTVVDNENSTVIDLEDVTESLVNQLVTIEESVQVIDIEELETFIEENNELNEETYTPETWNQWIDKKTEAIRLVQIVKETPRAVSRVKIKQMTQELKTARADLIEVTGSTETRESESSGTASTTEATSGTQNSTSNPNENRNKNQQRLLNTGETSSPVLLIIGILLSVIACGMIFSRKNV
ncbi:LPXTG cell wall anchor domain-containing protein [Candidatus Enterococcus palustris]|nr:LPXTG cell wall anchor domain-containing protein [Enterococcus sp. 7F3_DIV0205]